MQTKNMSSLTWLIKRKGERKKGNELLKASNGKSFRHNSLLYVSLKVSPKIRKQKALESVQGL